MFEQAARMKLRFETSRGCLSAEDLWDLPLTSAKGVSLDGIAIALHNRTRSEGLSFVDEAAGPDRTLVLKLDIVKHVIGVKKAESKAASEAHDRADRQQKILGIIARKDDAALESMSTEELRKLLA